jgi:chromosome segregation ATPase
MDSGLLTNKQDQQPLRRIFSEVAEMKDRLTQMGTFINQAAALAAAEASRVEEMQRNFEATVSTLEARLGEKEEALYQKDSELRELQENVTARICDLENRVREKEELLEVRGTELSELRLKNREAEALAMKEASRVEEIKQSFEATVLVLEAQLKQKEELLNQKDFALKDMKESLTELEESLLARIRELGRRFEGLAPEKAKQTRRRRESFKSPQPGIERTPG